MLPLLLACTGPDAAPESDPAPVESAPVDSSAGDTSGEDSAPPPDTEPPHTGDSAEELPPNVLVLVMDDVGVDKVGVYGVHDDPPPTPTLDALAADGVLFENAWAYPGCSPTRAAMLTGRHAPRTGLGTVLTPSDDQHWLLGGEVTLPELLAEAGYTSAAVGKWHLVAWAHGTPAMHPLEQGFAHFRGLMGNLHHVLSEGEQEPSYTYWQKATDGKLSWRTHYVTSEQADDVVAMSQQLPEPWFVYAGFTSAHEPYDVPPTHLTTVEVAADDEATARYDAVVEALDTELGRLLDSLDPEVRERTLVIVMGDNGTPGGTSTPPALADRAKESLYDGGVHVPLIVSGAGVVDPGRRSDALVSVVDLFPTLAELAQVDTADLVRSEGEHAGASVSLDGVSWLPVLGGEQGARATLLSSRVQPISAGSYDAIDVTVRNAGYKLIRQDATATWPQDELFRYAEGQYEEGENLLDQLGTDDELDAAYEALSAEVERFLGEVTYGP